MVHLSFILGNVIFIFSAIKCELIKQLQIYSINLRWLPIQHEEVAVMLVTVNQVTASQLFEENKKPLSHFLPMV